VRIVENDAKTPPATDCTTGTCNGGVPSRVPGPTVVPCSGGTGVCNVTGECVACVVASNCAGGDFCGYNVCSRFTCQPVYTAAGVPLPLVQQTPGDCKIDQCDGAGGVQLAPDDTDLPNDGNQCTHNVCTDGEPSHPAMSGGSVCSEGGVACDGAGQCVEGWCASASDCGTATACTTYACVANRCQANHAAAGTPLPPALQVTGDCQVRQCNGSGDVVSVADNSDLPNDGKQCTQNLCTAGVPSHPPRSEGTECTEGGNKCDGAGNCIVDGCLTDSECGTNTACTTYTCSSYNCNVVHRAAGTPCGFDGGTVCNGSGACIVTTAAGSPVSTGYAYSCAITSTGGVKCWGQNHYDQLGNGTTTGSNVPVQVAGLTSGVVSLSGTYVHTCALKSDGSVWCWGNNTVGQLGDGTTANRTTPGPVFGLYSGIVAIATGFNHTCALNSDGIVKCWGDNAYGQLGDGTYTQRIQPVQVLSGAVLANLTAGGLYSCAIASTGGVSCWGRNSWGQHGTGLLTETPIPIGSAFLATGIASVSAGPQHACAVTTAGGAKC